MKKMIMTLMMVLSMTIGANAQRLDNTYTEARILTDYIADELGLNSWQREKAYQMNLDYLYGIGSYRDIDARIWTLRNNQLKSILNAAQWKLYKKTSYFYRPISWKQGAYVHNIYARNSNKQQRQIEDSKTSICLLLCPFFLKILLKSTEQLKMSYL